MDTIFFNSLSLLWCLFAEKERTIISLVLQWLHGKKIKVQSVEIRKQYGDVLADQFHEQWYWWEFHVLWKSKGYIGCSKRNLLQQWRQCWSLWDKELSTWSTTRGTLSHSILQYPHPPLATTGYVWRIRVGMSCRL